MKTRYKNVTIAPDRHGKLRARFRKSGQKPVYMKGLPDQPGFDAEYQALQTGQELEPRYAPRTVNDLISRYYKSANFARGGVDDKRRRRGLIESFRNEFGNDLVSDFGPEHIEAILLARAQKRVNEKGREVGGQVAAVNLRKQLRRLFQYAKKPLKWISSNPVDDAEKVGSNKITGYRTWTEADIAAFKKQHPLGTKARLALEIFLWTWQRRGDARLFGPKHIVRGKINFGASKTNFDHWLPIAPDLTRAIEAMPAVGMTTFLVTDYGKPFSAAGLGNKMREWCDEAGLPHCSAHGLRKAGATRAANAEGTNQGLKAVGGWKNDQEVSTYTEAVLQEGLADVTMGRVIDKYGDRHEP